MYKKISIFALLLVLMATVSFAQDKAVHQKKPILIDEPIDVDLVQAARNIGNGTLAAAYVAVDTMQNCYGPAIASLNPVAYDPYTDIVAVIHRGATTYAAGSGTLYYNYTLDGTTWTRCPVPINSGLAFNARYPSMAILNYGYSTVIDDIAAVASWPQLTPGAFGYVGYAIDMPLGAAEPYAALITPGGSDPAFSSQVPIWTGDNTDWVFWASDNSTNADITLWKTQDYATIDEFTPTTWEGVANFADGFAITMGGVSFNGTDYYGVNGTFNFDDGSWVWPGYSKSTDNGATWSEWNVCNFTEIPALSDYDVLFDYNLDIYSDHDGDINVDKDGLVHLIVTLADTAADWQNYTKSAVVELYEDPAAASGWNAKIIASVEKTDFLWMYDYYTQTPNIGQMGTSPYLAFDVDREIMVVQWVNTGNIADTLAVMDIFYSYRNLEGEWATPVNITNTTNINESGSHLAPMMKKEAVTGGFDVTFYSMYYYEDGVTIPLISDVNRHVVYIAPVTQFVPITGVEDGLKLHSFALDQNYPNPFNPSTLISYTLAERSNVTLKVYDVLGKEVASLVNNSQEAGTHQVTFDASNLATGLYIYTLNAGNFTSSKKMMLIK